MRSRILFIASLLVSVCLLTLSGAPAEARIEAVKDKTYGLTKEHGPWMIMVTSLWGESKPQYERAEKAANTLVYELRKKGIPAYTFAQDSQIEHVNMPDRLGRERRRVYAAQRSMIGILAGNYSSVEDKLAQKTLKFIKQFQPEVLKEAGYTGQTEKVGPLSQAFLTVNPLLKPEEIARKTRDPLLLQLNSGMDYSLTENKGKYSVRVAAFYGQSRVKGKQFDQFAESLKKNARLDVAAKDAWELTRTMRAQKLEAYVYHDRFRSIVTVGSFDSPQDPRIPGLIQKFSAKYRKNPDTNQDVLVSESIQIPGANKGDPPLKGWVMDPYPEVIEVPRLK